jgi:hypothetical protein
MNLPSALAKPCHHINQKFMGFLFCFFFPLNLLNPDPPTPFTAVSCLSTTPISLRYSWWRNSDSKTHQEKKGQKQEDVLTVSDLRDENTLPHPHQMRTNVGGKRWWQKTKRRKSHGGHMTTFQLFSGRRYFRKLKFQVKRGGSALYYLLTS